MATRAYTKGGRQQGWFAVIYEGLETTLVRAFTLPTLEYEIAKFGGAGTFWDHKEAGRLQVSEAEMEKYIKSEETDDWAWVIFMRALGKPPVGYQNKDLVVCELNAAMDRYMRQWTLKSAWSNKLTPPELKGGGSEPSTEKLSFACDYVDFKNL
jgi:hypothetical protein